ncbi:unnamed protein product [Linum trigynum]|uniref:Uncharacterized protein n=1 Tax=Linum trigynum TaxID=586398 RepID=A0AAV2FXJ9_9ROSI
MEMKASLKLTFLVVLLVFTIGQESIGVEGRTTDEVMKCEKYCKAPCECVQQYCVCGGSSEEQPLTSGRLFPHPQLGH